MPDPSSNPTQPIAPDLRNLESRQSLPTTVVPRIALGRLTGTLLGLSVVVAIMSQLGEKREILDPLFISANDSGTLPEIAHGQVWRVLTPIFIHFGAIHLIFNLLWLKDLGSVIERVFGWTRLLALVLTSAVLSNLGQFYFTGPYFGGMSGVVYSLFGFVWMRSKFDPACGLRLTTQTVVLMIGWFFFCMRFGDIANYAHGIGLAVGMAWGFFLPKTGDNAA